MNRKKDRLSKIVEILKKEYPNTNPQLNYSNPFELLIATILSAQCTDERVNIVTKNLFKKYKSPIDYYSVEVTVLEKDIFSTGFYKNKARNIQNCCKILEEENNSKVPIDFEALCNLPGVGRKTASVVIGNAFGIPALAVDTHVKRISNLLELTKSTNPDKIELDLKKILPENDWINFTHWLIQHGRKVCIARRPQCGICKIADYCPSRKL